jgi:hypothetical protein
MPASEGCLSDLRAYAEPLRRDLATAFHIGATHGSAVAAFAARAL